MSATKARHRLAGLLAGTWLAVSTAGAGQLQCPNDLDKDPTGNFPGPEDVDHNGNGILDSDPNAVCLWIQGGDGFSRMADGYTIYHFGFSPVPLSLPEEQAQAYGTLQANLPAPTIYLDEGQELYLNLGNTGFALRPDVDDGHTVHWHGFPEQSAIHDGVPELSPAPRIGAIFTYWYKAVHPGTYFYHCHFEAPEHIQLGMVGNLYVRPAQNGTPIEYPPGSGRVFTKFAYNDGDGSTGYDVEKALQIIDFDRYFHDQFMNVQPDPFYNTRPSYPLINGRGYPDTVNPDPISNDETTSQFEAALVEAEQGQRILLRLSSVSTNAHHTVGVLGIPMLVVGKDAKLLRGPGGADLSYRTNWITIGGGESFDVILDTGPDVDRVPTGNFPGPEDTDRDGDGVFDGVQAGTYFFFSRTLTDLNNYRQARGGLMTEIRISAPAAP
jgi:FtsP/CotA-like multicopper oxidase with cupredoxin domain